MANTFKFGNKNWAWKEGSVLAYNDENNNFKPLPFDFTRSSSATRVNKDGLIEVVGSDEPRVDYLNNADGHLLLEPSRTNQVDNSIDFFAGSWSGTRIAEGSTIVSPDGSNNAHKLVPSTDNNTHYRVYTYSSASAGSYTASAFFKKGEYEVGVVRLDADSAANRIGVAINLSDGTFISQNTVGTPTGTSYKIEDYGSGWYRLSVTITHTSGDVRINVSTASNSWGWSNGLPLFIGDDSSGAYSWGAMIEAGSYATSYIPTSGSSVTRAAETTDAIAAPSGIIGQTEGTLYIEADCFLSGTTGGARKSYIHLNDGTFNNRIEITKLGGANLAIANDIRVRLSAGGVTAFDEVVAEDFEGKLKIAFAYESGNTAVYINGSSVYVNNSAITVPSTDEIYVGGAYNIATEEPIADARIYNTRLTNAELIALTS
jgi:hypothetical protein